MCIRDRARSYPYNENYTHLLGYVAQASQNDLINNEEIKKKHVPGLRVGKIGLERSLENDLIGINGVQRYEVNAYGKRINQIDHIEGQKGKSIRLTVDTKIQQKCNELLKDRAGSISVMDIYTGDILAMHSSPSFDPNLFLYGISYENWEAIKSNPKKPLINRSITGLYPPGSTIKPIVALSALEIDGGTDIGADLVDADEIIVDDGGGGTNRRSDLERVKKYIYSSMSGDATASDAGAVTIANDAIESGMLNDNVISGQTALTSGLATTDELLISDGGTLKKMDVSVLSEQFASADDATALAIALG